MTSLYDSGNGTPGAGGYICASAVPARAGRARRPRNRAARKLRGRGERTARPDRPGLGPDDEAGLGCCNLVTPGWMSVLIGKPAQLWRQPVTWIYRFRFTFLRGDSVPPGRKSGEDRISITGLSGVGRTFRSGLAGSDQEEEGARRSLLSREVLEPRGPRRSEVRARARGRGPGRAFAFSASAFSASGGSRVAFTMNRLGACPM